MPFTGKKRHLCIRLSARTQSKKNVKRIFARELYTNASSVMNIWI